MSTQINITFRRYKWFGIAGIITICGLLYCPYAAQSARPDSITFLQKSSIELDKGNYEEALRIAQYGLNSDQLKPFDKILYLRQIGLVYQKQNSWSGAEIYFHKALSLCDSTDAPIVALDSLKVELLLGLGSLHLMYTAQYNQSLEYIIAGVKISEASRDTNLMIRSYRLLGYVHRQLKDYTSSARYNRLAIDLASNVRDTLALVYLLNELANVHVLTGGDFDTSMLLYNEALDYAVRAGDKYCIAFVHNDIGNLFFTMGDYKKALPYLRFAFILNQEIEKYREVCVGALNIASCFFELGFYDSTSLYLDKGMKIADRYSLRSEKLTLYQTMGQLRAAMNDYKGAYQYHQEYMSLHDSIYNAEKERLIAEITSKYETEKKEKENRLLRQQNTIHQLQAEKANANLRFVIIAAGLFVIFITGFIWLLIRSNNARKKTNEVLKMKNIQINQQKDQLVETLHHLSQRERKLEEANATKDRFFSIIAHDIKNPFSGILGLSKLLKDDFDSLTRADQRHYIGYINESSDQLYKLLDNLLQWARAQLNQIDPKPEQIAIGGLINNCVLLYKNIALSKNIRIEFDPECSLFAYADQGMVETIIRNLLSNAIKFTPGGGVIKIIVSRVEKEVEINISDSGIGMSDEEQNKIFKIDGRLQKNGTASEHGSGLGLIICKEFVERNQGSIRLRSKVGEGSQFTITLPEG